MPNVTAAPGGLFHGTSVDRAASIMERGLIPSSPGSFFAGPVAVYLTDTLAYAAEFARGEDSIERQRDYHRGVREPIVFAVDAAGLELKRLREVSFRLTPAPGRTWVCFERVPPERLRVVERV